MCIYYIYYIIYIYVCVHVCVCVPLCDLIESMRKMDEHGLRIHFGGKKLGAPLFGLLLANQDACVPTLEPC